MTSKKIRYGILVVVVYFQVPLAAIADIQGIHLSEACNILAGMGFPTTGWITYYDNETGCSSRQKSIGPGNPFKNQIAYYVDGNGQTVRQLRLIVSVLNPDEWETAHAEFQKTAEFLIMKITGKPAPESISNAIGNGIDLVLKTDGIFIEVARKKWTMNTDWDSRQCYEIKLVIR